MTKLETPTFRAGVLELNQALNNKDVSFDKVNLILDQLNALDFQNSCHGEEDTVDLVVKCCISIPTNNSLLIGKSCNLILNHILKNKIVLGNKNLVLILSWAKKALHTSSDLAFLDILQLINVIIKNHQTFFTEFGVSSLSFLFEKLESRASVLQPNDIKLWRVYCLHSLSKTSIKEDRNKEVSELLSILYNQATDNLLVHSKIWRTSIEALDCLAAKGNSKWVLNKLSEIIGVLEVSTNLGLDGKEPSLPKQVFPSSFIAPEFPGNDSPSKNLNKTQPGKKKQKSKAKRVSWVEKADKEDPLESKGLKSFEVFQASGLTSDSDYSDTETGRGTSLVKEQAKTRHAAFNLIIRLSNILKGKKMYGYYSILLNALIINLRNETSNKTRVGALAALGALLMHSKPFLAQAQYSEGTPYLGFSGSLSELVSGLHSCLCSCLCSVPQSSILVPLLHATATLISVTPYHRLQPSLLTNTFANIHPYIRNKDYSVCVGVLKCLNEIASLNPGTEEQKVLLKKGLKLSDHTSYIWVMNIVLTLLKDEGINEAMRLACWQLIGNLSKHHFELVEVDLPKIEEMLFVDLKSTKTGVQLYATFALNKLLEGIITKEKLQSYNRELWLKLLKGPLVALLQSPEVIACEACDCLANMGPLIFNSLKEDEQILVVTLIFGCINHEKATVRAAAVHTLGIFLLFPQMMTEQFLYDARDLLVKSLSDSSLLVRIKAAWAIGNLVDLVINNLGEESFSYFNLKGILKAGLELVKDDETVRSNILRSLGLLLSVLKDEDLSDQELNSLLEKAVLFLLMCSTSGTNMKVRWNACHALSTMLKNKNLLPYSKKWMAGLIQTLCRLIVSCGNFKVRANACTALCQIPERSYFGLLYSFVWTSLLDGLENAVNLPDFKEYKHQAGLKQHLCSAICHITMLLETEDIPELENLLDFRQETLREYMDYFQKNTLPEQAAISIAATNNIQRLINSSHSHQSFLFSLKDIFNVVQFRPDS